jgi:putative Ca2+/H+ antiporter (TMEM165/GDT1 family)
MDLAVSFVIVFAVIAGTELVDRTNFALIGLAAKNPPLPVWAGAAGAFLITTGVAVVAGALLVDALRSEIVWLRVGGGLFLIGYALYVLRVPESERKLPVGRTAGATAFLTILLLETGDTTQWLTIGFVFTQPNVIVVGVAAAAALLCVAGTAVFLGRTLGARVEPALLERVIVVVLLTVGVLTILLALDPGLLPAV